jgi:hypothetical protein
MGSKWMVQIFEMSDEDAQRMIGAILSGVDGLAVEFAATGAARFLIVDSGTAAQAVAVERLVKAIDPRAAVIHTSTRAAAQAEAAA